MKRKGGEKHNEGERSRAGGDPCGCCPKKRDLQEREGELFLEKIKGGSCNLTAALSHPFAELMCKARVLTAADVCKVLSLLHQKLSWCSPGADKKARACWCHVLQ